MDDEYSSFLKDMDSDTKRAKLDDGKPYVPPMGDLASRVGKALNKPAPRLMLTNGSAAPGASIKAAKYRESLLFIIINDIIFCTGKPPPPAAIPT